MTYLPLPVYGLTSLLLTSTDFLLGGRPVADATHHLSNFVNILWGHPDYQSYRIVLQGLREVTASAPPSKGELAEELYHASMALSLISTDQPSLESLAFTIQGLARIIRTTGDGPKPSGGLFRRDVAQDHVEEDRWRTLAALTNGVCHDVGGIITRLKAVLDAFPKDVKRITPLMGTDGDPNGLNAPLSELQEKMDEIFRLFTPIRLALYLALPKRRALLDEPFRNGDIGRLAQSLDGFQDPLQKTLASVKRIVAGLDSRETTEETADIAANLRETGGYLSGIMQMMTTGVDLLKSLLLIHAGMGNRLKTPVSLHDNLNPVMIQSVLGRGIALTMNLEPDPGPVTGPACHIKQVLYNLVVNARDAIQGGGSVTITTQRTIVKKRKFDAAPGEYMALSVQDTGTGIPGSRLPHIFKAGISGKGSSGLGLYVIREIVRGLGGFIQVRTSTTEPCGTTFLVYFPIPSAETGRSTLPRSRNK